MDHLSAELPNPLQPGVHVRNGEVRERHSIARARSPRMEAEGRAACVCLPSLALVLDAALELYFEKPGPEPASPGEVVGGELHEAQGQGHATTITAWGQEIRGARAQRCLRIKQTHREEFLRPGLKEDFGTDPYAMDRAYTDPPSVPT
jgi:hypothetical protein